jgi:hypothetical protein
MITIRRGYILRRSAAVPMLVFVLVPVRFRHRVLVELQFEQTPPKRRQSQLPKCPTIKPHPSDGFRRQL